MVAEISGVGLAYSVVGQLGLADVRQRAVEPPGEFGPQDKQTPSTDQVGGVFSRLRVSQDALNQAASVVREVGHVAGQADRLLGRMQEDLSTVVKMFPPYPLDNPERISFLNSFAGLRKQVEALTFPPPEQVDVVARLSGEFETAEVKDGLPVAEAVAAVTKSLWDIATLDPLSANDAEVGKALDQVQSAQSALEQLRRGMWHDVAGFVQQADSSEVRTQGAGAREQLAELGNRAIGANGRLLQQAAESG